MSSNMQRLGETLASRMKKTSAAAIPTTIELGTIGSNLSLTTDSLPVPIPKGDYLVTVHLAHNNYQTSISGGTESNEKHGHQLPSVFRRLQAGDRVLVAWCGNDPVVIDIVVPGDATISG